MQNVNTSLIIFKTKAACSELILKNLNIYWHFILLVPTQIAQTVEILQGLFSYFSSWVTSLARGNLMTTTVPVRQPGKILVNELHKSAKYWLHNHKKTKHNFVHILWRYNIFDITSVVTFVACLLIVDWWHDSRLCDRLQRAVHPTQVTRGRRYPAGELPPQHTARTRTLRRLAQNHCGKIDTWVCRWHCEIFLCWCTIKFLITHSLGP